MNRKNVHLIKNLIEYQQPARDYINAPKALHLVSILLLHIYDYCDI